MADGEYDYIVVGAGAAGAVVAARLSVDPHRSVLLLEAGPTDRTMAVRTPAAFARLFDTERDWGYRTVPQPELAGRRIYWPRGRMLGGSSSMNAMMWVRGFAADYAEWGALAGQPWSAQTALRQFQRIEDTAEATGDHQGRGGMMAVSPQRAPRPLTADFLAACADRGLPMADHVNGPHEEGFAATMVTQRGGRRFSTVDGYLTAAAERPNLTVLTEAHTTRVLFDGDRASGVEYLRGDDRLTARAAAEVILAAGAVNSPQLLMLSGIGPADPLRANGIHVRHASAEVGANLRDHLIAGIVAGAEEGTLYDATKPRALAHYLARHDGPLTSCVGEAYGFLRSTPELALPDLEILFAPAPFVGEGLVKPPGHGFVVAAVLLRPASTGTITLASADPRAAPRIDPRYLTDDRDVAALRHGLERVDDLLAAPPLAGQVQGCLQPPGMYAGVPRREEALRRYSHTLYHPVGTCRMGIDDDAVVDGRLRVRGVQGLRVADASVMPAIVRGHTHAASILIGEQLAEFILGEQ